MTSTKNLVLFIASTTTTTITKTRREHQIVIVVLPRKLTTSNAGHTAITETKTSTPSSTISTLILQTT
jgi:hypothetical protein